MLQQFWYRSLVRIFSTGEKLHQEYQNNDLRKDLSLLAHQNIIQTTQGQLPMAENRVVFP